MSRITLDTSFQDALAGMSDGNPGAINAMLEMSTVTMKEKHPLDVFYPLLGLDGWGIYGTDIYVLWSDICDKDSEKAVKVIKAAQQGLIDSDLLKLACSKQDYSGKDMINMEVLDDIQ